MTAELVSDSWENPEMQFGKPPSNYDTQSIPALSMNGFPFSTPFIASDRRYDPHAHPSSDEGKTPFAIHFSVWPDEVRRIELNIQDSYYDNESQTYIMPAMMGGGGTKLVIECIDQTTIWLDGFITHIVDRFQDVIYD